VRNPPRAWAWSFRAFVMSAPQGADLLKARNWTCTNRLRDFRLVQQRVTLPRCEHSFRPSGALFIRLALPGACAPG